ncbi:hypothetical protein GCK72_024582 [Caenorhabditis remanei]|uniref:Uncharacterized protein n=1 Tax=Caenorhabditis remanei TaxID=31234 RepID=A0A6A5G0A4_CAERE|nr:hypothetical protein GCK72_024582 [Caenorhabditis remanei]KAF1748115.1 hypothetical protein GCK72_024582 [Caenorhabditis remanei]
MSRRGRTARGQIDPRYARTVERIRSSMIRRGEEDEEPDLATLTERNMQIAEALGAQSWKDRTEELRSMSTSGGRTKYVRKIRFTRECGNCGNSTATDEIPEEGSSTGPSLAQAVSEYLSTGRQAKNLRVDESYEPEDDSEDEEHERELARKMLSQPTVNRAAPPKQQFKEFIKGTKEYEEQLAIEKEKLINDMKELRLLQLKRDEEDKKRRAVEDRIKEEKEKKRLAERQKIVDAAIAEREASGNTDMDYVVYVFDGKAHFLRASPLEDYRPAEKDRCVLKYCSYHSNKSSKNSSGSRY